MRLNGFFLLLCMLTANILSAQLLKIVPGFPQDNTSLSIEVDCSKGNQGLFNYSNTNDVYVHVGVITNLSNSASDWKYVKFTWGTTDALAKATSLGSNRYKYDIGNIRSFFGVPGTETILKVTVLFRNGAGTSVQRNADGSDMYITVYDNSLHVNIVEPFKQPTYLPIPEPVNVAVGSPVNIQAGASISSDMKIFFNGTLAASNNGIVTLSASPVVSASGNQLIIAEATIGAVTKRDTLNFFVAPTVSVQPLPAGVRDGINYEPGDTSVILVLYAPNKTRVAVIGEFNDWIETSASQMNRTPDGLRYWKRLTGFTPTTEYAFQYLVDGILKIAEPYTKKVLDPWNDTFISSATYPSLKPYPTGKTNGIVSIIQTAAPDYAWQVNNFSKPDKRGLIIYELLVRDFVANHDWQTIKDTLAYLKNLGVNAIEFMPFNEFEGNNSWGYNPSYYFAPDKYYGPENKLKALVDECHKQGIAVLMDIALNHSFGQSPMVQLYFDAASGRPSAENPWFNPVARHAFNVGYDMNHESPATRYFVSRVVEYWLTEFRLDGFRFDLSKGFTQTNTCDANGNNCNVGGWSNYDASRVAIWKRYYDTLQLKAPGCYVILEHFADNNEEKELSDYGMMLWGNMNFNFSEATRGNVGSSDFSGALHTVRTWSQPHLIAYMESHDEERLMYKNINSGNAAGSYNIRDLNTALKRNEMASAFLFMMPGPKMIWQFGEMGYDFSINYCTNGTTNPNCRLDPKPIRWDYLSNSSRKKLRDVTAALLQLRVHPLYRNGFVTNRAKSNLAGAFKWYKLTTDTSNILVVGNFDVVPATTSVAFQNSGNWYDYLTDQVFSATGALQSITLQPGEYHVYINRNIKNVTPVTDVIYNEKKLSLSVYPNPFVRGGSVKYELPESGTVNISLMNAAGQQVSVLYAGFRTKGIHQLILTDLTTSNKFTMGVYFLRLQFNNRQLVQKLIVDFR